MSTTLDIQLDVATQLGKADGNVANSRRDQAIIKAKRKFYKEYPWSCLKKSASLTFASGVLDFPADYDPQFEPKIYTYTSNYKTEYKLVALEDVDSYTSAVPVFSIDQANSHFVTNVDATVEITYQIAVPETTVTAYVEPATDITAIVNLAIAIWWLSTERNTENYDRFMTIYKEELTRLVRMDRLKDPVRYLNIDTTNYGYNGDE
jgi:hypothetical protein